MKAKTQQYLPKNVQTITGPKAEARTGPDPCALIYQYEVSHGFVNTDVVNREKFISTESQRRKGGTEGRREKTLVLWGRCQPPVLSVRTSRRSQSLLTVDTCSADSASLHTGTSQVHQETPVVPSVGKKTEHDLDC